MRAAGVKRALQHARFGFLGNNYSGMLDMYSDFTMLQAQTGIHVEILEMCDLDRCLKAVTEEEVAGIRQEVEAFFEISGDSPSDPIAKRPTAEQLDWACRVAAAQRRLVKEYRLDALSYYYHGSDNNHYEQLQSGFIVGHSLLTANGIPCAGEGDIKTCLAMKICDLLGLGGSFTEIVAMDYERGTMILGHDGPFHIRISDGKPILRGMGVYLSLIHIYADVESRWADMMEQLNVMGLDELEEEMTLRFADELKRYHDAGYFTDIQP